MKERCVGLMLPQVCLPGLPVLLSRKFVAALREFCSLRVCCCHLLGPVCSAVRSVPTLLHDFSTPSADKALIREFLLVCDRLQLHTEHCQRHMQHAHIRPWLPYLGSLLAHCGCATGHCHKILCICVLSV